MPSNYVNFLGQQGLAYIAEFSPIVLQEDIDGYHAIALPPPLFCQEDEVDLVLLCLEALVIIDGGDIVVLILYDADILRIAIFD